MARIRTIKPEFWTSEQVVECSLTARLLFIGLWNFCDDAGRHKASVQRLKMEVFPGDDLTRQDVQNCVDELLDAGLITEYEVGGESYWEVKGWHHQKIDNPNVRYPGPSGTIEQPTKRLGGKQRKLAYDKLVARDGELCNTCRETEELQVVHVVPIAKGGTNELDNLELRCKPCSQGDATPAGGDAPTNSPVRDGYATSTRQVRDEYAAGTRQVRDGYAPPEGKGRESKGKEGNGKGTHTATTNSHKRGMCDEEEPKTRGLDPHLMATQLMNIWNPIAKRFNLQRVGKLTDERVERVAQRCRDPDFPRLFREACERKLPVPNTPDFTWQPSFGWLIENGTNVVELLEGKYDRRKPTAPTRRITVDDCV